MKSIICSLLTLLCASAIAHASSTPTPLAAGPQGSGGGKGVVCRDKKTNQIKSAELLDLWEAKNLYGRTIKHSKAPLDQQVLAAFAALKYAIYNDSGYYYDGRPMDATQYLTAHLEDSAAYFLKPNSVAHWLTGVTLEPTPDSFEQAEPDDCGIEQIVTYNDSTTVPNILINKDLWNYLDLTNRAALIVHEALYAYLRGMHESDSLRTRRSVGYVFGGNVFEPIMSLTSNDTMVCDGISDSATTNSFSEFVFFKDESNKTAIIPLTVSSEPMIGFFAPPEANRTVIDLIGLTQKDPSCAPQYSQTPAPNGLGNWTEPISVTTWSPIDTNVDEYLYFVCDGSKRQVYYVPGGWNGSLENTPPTNAAKLFCHPFASPSKTQSAR